MYRGDTFGQGVRARRSRAFSHAATTRVVGATGRLVSHGERAARLAPHPADGWDVATSGVGRHAAALGGRPRSQKDASAAAPPADRTAAGISPSGGVAPTHHAENL